MYLHLKNPLAFFDLETTGTNISQDRIVEIAIVKLMPNGERITKDLRINPQIPIPPEATLIHGISDEDVKDAPPFKNVAKELAKFLEGSDLGGFNIIKFDLPLLVEEFLRAGVDFEVNNRKLIDVQKLFHLMEKRTLAAAFKFYCDKDLKDAHSALADTEASLEVFDAQIQMYEGQDAVDLRGNKLGSIENDIARIHELSNSNMVDLAGRIILNEAGEEIYNFGKHKGKRVVDVFELEPQYYDWIVKNDFPMDTKRRLTQIKLRTYNR